MFSYLNKNWSYSVIRFYQLLRLLFRLNLIRGYYVWNSKQLPVMKVRKIRHVSFSVNFIPELSHRQRMKLQREYFKPLKMYIMRFVCNWYSTFVILKQQCSWQENVFRVTGFLWGHPSFSWIFHTKGHTELWFFVDVILNKPFGILRGQACIWCRCIYVALKMSSCRMKTKQAVWNC